MSFFNLKPRKKTELLNVYIWAAEWLSEGNKYFYCGESKDVGFYQELVSGPGQLAQLVRASSQCVRVLS